MRYLSGCKGDLIELRMLLPAPTIRIHLGDYRAVLAHVRADLIVTSPPYNIGSKAPAKRGPRRIDPRTGKRRVLKPGEHYAQKDFAAITDYEDTLPEHVYQDQQAEFLIWCADHLNERGILVYNHKPRRRRIGIHPCEWLMRPEVRSRLQYQEEVIWDRGSTHNHCSSIMWQQTERLYIFTRRGDRYSVANPSADIWRIAPSRNKDRDQGHNAPFPLALIERAVATWARPGALVCDPYAGSGTTAVAALRAGLCFEGAEILEKYHRLAVGHVEREETKPSTTLLSASDATQPHSGRMDR